MRRVAFVNTADADLVGCAVIVVGAEHDRADEELLANRGAVVERCTLRHPVARPTDMQRLARSISRASTGEVDAVMFTAAAAASAWISLAQRADALDLLRRRVDVGRLLLISAEHSDAAGDESGCLPIAIGAVDRSTSLALQVIEHFTGGDAPSLSTDFGWIQVRSGGVAVEDGFIPLSRSAVALMDALAAARGRVVSRAELDSVLPGEGRTAHAVEVAIARLRETLGDRALIQTVVKRGYRLAVTDG